MRVRSDPFRTRDAAASAHSAGAARPANAGQDGLVAWSSRSSRSADAPVARNRRVHHDRAAIAGDEQSTSQALAAGHGR